MPNRHDGASRVRVTLICSKQERLECMIRVAKFALEAIWLIPPNNRQRAIKVALSRWGFQSKDYHMILRIGHKRRLNLNNAMLWRLLTTLLWLENDREVPPGFEHMILDGTECTDVCHCEVVARDGRIDSITGHLDKILIESHGESVILSVVEASTLIRKWKDRHNG